MPSVVLGHVFPYDQDAPRRLEKWMRELEMVALIVRYEHLGVAYGWLPGWAKHQKVNRPSQSELPAPPSLNGYGSNHDTFTEDSVRAQ